MPIEASTGALLGSNPGNGVDGQRLPFDARFDGWWQSRLARALAYRPQLGAVPLRKPHREGASDPARVTRTERNPPHGERLLVVDSDPVYRKLVSEIAKDLDYSVEASPDGREFKQTYVRFQPTAVVLDLLLPDGDGVQLLNFLIHEASDARVIVISEINDRLRDATNTWVSAYGLRLIANLPKPVEPETLRAALDPAAAPDNFDRERRRPQQMPTSPEHGHGLEPAPKPDEPIAHGEFILELRRSLVEVHAQALWLDMPTVAHFIEVAALDISESAHDPKAALGPPTGSDEPGN